MKLGKNRATALFKKRTLNLALCYYLQNLGNCQKNLFELVKLIKMRNNPKKRFHFAKFKTRSQDLLWKVTFHKESEKAVLF